jgi:hypothetical protein
MCLSERVCQSSAGVETVPVVALAGRNPVGGRQKGVETAEVSGMAAGAVAVVGPGTVGSVGCTGGVGVGTGSACGGAGGSGRQRAVGSRPAGSVGWDLGRGLPEGSPGLAGVWSRGLCCASWGPSWALWYGLN